MATHVQSVSKGGLPPSRCEYCTLTARGSRRQTRAGTVLEGIRSGSGTDCRCSTRRIAATGRVDVEPAAREDQLVPGEAPQTQLRQEGGLRLSQEGRRSAHSREGPLRDTHTGSEAVGSGRGRLPRGDNQADADGEASSQKFIARQ